MNKQRNRLKIFRKYKDIACNKNEYIEIDFVIFLELQSSQIGKAETLETIEDDVQEYEDMLKEGWKRLICI